MVTRNVPAKDIDLLLSDVKARKGNIRYREPVRVVTTQPTQHDADVWKTYTTGEALAYPVPVLAVDELRLRLIRSVRYLGSIHPEELEKIRATRFKLTMRVEDAAGKNLIGNGLPTGNPALKELDHDTLVLLNFHMHAPLNRGMRAKQNKAAPPQRTRGKTIAARA